MNPNEPSILTPFRMLAYVVLLLPVVSIGCNHSPSLVESGDPPPPIYVNWEGLPFKMLVTQREYVGFKGWKEGADGRIGRIILLDPSTRTISTVVESNIYEFRGLRVNRATSQWFFLSDLFPDGVSTKVFVTTPHGRISRVSETHEGQAKHLAVSRSGNVAFSFVGYSGMSTSNSESGIWVGSGLLIHDIKYYYTHPAWEDETHLLLTCTINSEQEIFRISVPDTSVSLVINRLSPALAATSTDRWAEVQSPEVSPDGDRIAFQFAYATTTGDNVRSLWIIHGQDTTEILRTAARYAQMWESRFSPDGMYIAVMREDGNIWILRTDGGGSTRVVTGGWIWAFDWM